jgi:hypothetical protein
MARRPMEAAGAVDAQNAPTVPWKTAQNAVSHSYHRHSHREPKCYPCSRLTLLPMFPVAHHLDSSLARRQKSVCSSHDATLAQMLDARPG